MQVQFDFNRNKYFDTKEAVEYGIIDQVRNFSCACMHVQSRE